MSEKKERVSHAATTLTYTENEMAAINALIAHKGKKLTFKELGLASGIVLQSLAKKAEKVNTGVLANPDNLPVLDIKSEKEVRVVQVEKPVTVYFIED